VRVERLLDDANRALGPVPSTVSTVKGRQAEAPRGGALASSLEGRPFGNRN
jgi:hypothetical protein